jgi:4-diphosphocytidyl-2-C-methyl-D-erythritol kinase
MNFFTFATKFAVMIVYPNAKINVGLHITGKRSDGFHTIESCFVPIGLTDILEILPSGNEIKFNSSGIPIPGKSMDNLCVTAWKILNKEFSIPPVTIHLHKQIPIGAGLGGGSADGAFALKALNELFQLKLTAKQLENYAARLGSDCAFFIQNHPAYAEGRGEILSHIQLKLDGYSIFLVNPGIHIGTAEAYAGITPNMPEKDLREFLQLPVSEWQNHVVNNFEPGIFKSHPKIEQVKNKLIDLGAEYAAMSGSGSSVFGLFKESIAFNPAEIFKGLFYWEGTRIP